MKCCDYLGKNAGQDSLKYIVIETAKVDFSDAEIDKLLFGKIDFIQSYSTGILYVLQKLPYFRLLYSQFEHGLLKLFLPRGGTKKTAGDEAVAGGEENYNRLFSFIERNSNGKKIIIFYHPTGLPNNDGNLVYGTRADCRALFEKSALNHGVCFVDLTERTTDLWEKAHKTTHGFSTGAAFSGHLNRNGHELAARAVFEEIIRCEAEHDSF